MYADANETYILILPNSYICIDFYHLTFVAIDPAEGEHGGGEPSCGGAEPESPEGEPSLTRAESGAT